jgi:hypothetical protein
MYGRLMKYSGLSSLIRLEKALVRPGYAVNDTKVGQRASGHRTSRKWIWETFMKISLFGEVQAFPGSADWPLSVYWEARSEEKVDLSQFGRI